MEISRRKLRTKYSTMRLEEFLELTDLFNIADDEDAVKDVYGLLDAAEKIALENARRDEITIREIGEKISASLLHRQKQFHCLASAVPEGIEYEYASAILIYGFIMPSSRRTFAGSRGIDQTFVRLRVDGKLLNMNAEQFNSAWQFLIREGVIKARPAGGYSLNIHGESATKSGLKIVKEMLQLLSLS